MGEKDGTRLRACAICANDQAACNGSRIGEVGLDGIRRWGGDGREGFGPLVNRTLSLYMTTWTEEILVRFSL